jgi:hypothetical protein
MRDEEETDTKAWKMEAETEVTWLEVKGLEPLEAAKGKKVNSPPIPGREHCPDILWTERL